MRVTSPVPAAGLDPTSWWQRRLLPLLLLLAAVVVAASGGTATAASRHTAASTPKPLSAKAWAKLVTQAKREGSVSLYSTQIPARLADVAAAFEKKYGIPVKVNRQVDNVLLTQVNAERSTGKYEADLWVSNSRPYVLGALENSWVVAGQGPHFFAKGFDRSTFAKPGKAWVVGTAVLGYAWNTQQVQKPLSSFTDVLDPALRGRIGVLRPGSPAAIDWYLWAQERFGSDFLTKLAAQKPKVYVSTVPMQQALASGEIAAGTFVGTNVKDLIAQGAPITFKLPSRPWNTPYYAMILQKAAHPAAAQLLADYLLSPEGQAIVNKDAGAVLKNVPGTLYVAPRAAKLSELTPQKIEAFQSKWNGLFG
jgi:iron(III) transport system substrate-binding protein